MTQRTHTITLQLTESQAKVIYRAYKEKGLTKNAMAARLVAAVK